MEANRKVGWAKTKLIPNFRTQSLKTASGYLPWNPVAVKVFPGFIRVATPSPIWVPKSILYNKLISF